MISNLCRQVPAFIKSPRGCQKISAVTLLIFSIVAIIIGTLALYNNQYTSLSKVYKIPSLALINHTYSVMLIAGGGIFFLLGLAGLFHN